VACALLARFVESPVVFFRYSVVEVVYLWEKAGTLVLVLCLCSLEVRRTVSRVNANSVERKQIFLTVELQTYCKRYGRWRSRLCYRFGLYISHAGGNMCHGYACKKDEFECEMCCKFSVAWSSILISNWDVTRYYRSKSSPRYDGGVGKGE
jgi:hypothetical protein